jgi:peroxiredoxin
MQGPWFILFVVQWVIVLVLVFLVAGILRHLAAVEERWKLAAPPITSYELGQRIADFELPNAAGALVRMIDLLRRPNGAILLFATTSCTTCEALLAQVEEFMVSSPPPFNSALVVIAAGKGDIFEHLFSKHPGLSNGQTVMLADGEGKVFNQFGITAVPVGLALDRQGRVTHQTHNPHVANWLYTRLGVTPPPPPATPRVTSIMTPAAFKQR